MRLLRFLGISCNFLLVILGDTLFTRSVYDRYQLWEAEMTDDHASILEKNFARNKQILMSEKSQSRKRSLLVSPDLVPLLRTSFTLLNIKHYIKRENIQDYLDAEQTRLAARAITGQYDKNDWNSFNSIMHELDYLKTKCPEKYTCTIQTIGYSYDNRPIKLFQITKEGNNRRVVWLDSLIHAREWLAGSTLMLILDHLVKNGARDPEVRSMLDSYDWYFVPVVNPDGYDYTWTHERFWRKNRTPTRVPECPGVDLNRNFDIQWDSELGKRYSDHCLETYRGESANSEPETQALIKETSKLAGKIDVYIALHTTAKVWLWSWSFEGENHHCVPLTGVDKLMTERVGNATTKATAETYGTVWKGGSCCKVMYPVSGCAMDYMKAIQGIPLSYTAELRGDLFDPSIDNIPLSFWEIWNGLVAMVNEIDMIKLETTVNNYLSKH